MHLSGGRFIDATGYFGQAAPGHMDITDRMLGLYAASIAAVSVVVSLWAATIATEDWITIAAVAIGFTFLAPIFLTASLEGISRLSGAPLGRGGLTGIFAVAWICCMGLFLTIGSGNRILGISGRVDDGTAAVPASAQGWLQFGGSVARTSYSLVLGPDEPNMLWTFRTGGRIQSPPVVDREGRAYIGSEDSSLYAINEDGTLVWELKTGGGIYASPAIGSERMIYAGSADSNLYAIGPDGTVEWRSPMGGKVNTSPAVTDNGFIYVGTTDGILHALDTNGVRRWTYSAEGDLTGAPAVGPSQTVYIGSWDGYLYAISSKGRLKWRHRMGNIVDSAPVVGANGTIYAGSWNGRLLAFSSDGRKRWDYKPQEGFGSSPAIGPEGTLYFGTTKGRLYALFPEGWLKWQVSVLRTSVGRSIGMSPAVDRHGTVYLAHQSAVQAFDPDGTVAWMQSISEQLSTSAVLGPTGRVYVGSAGGTLYVVGSE